MFDFDSAKGLRLDVLRLANGFDGSNYGPSARAEKITLIGSIDDHGIVRAAHDNAAVFPATDSAPAFFLTYGANDSVNLIPASSVRLTVEDGRYIANYRGITTAGGNFAHTSDSRLTMFFDDIRRARFYGAIAIHDRREY